MINVLLVDDQRLIRDGLRALLEKSAMVRVVGIAENGQAAIEQVEALSPDVVLMDIHMPVLEGIPATRIITQRFPKTRVLILSTEEEDTYLMEALKAGAQGYLLKQASVKEIIDAIQLIHAGHSQVGPGLLGKIVARISAPTEESTPTLAENLLPLDLELTRLLNRFDAIEVADFVRRVVEQPNWLELMPRVKAHLEQESCNLTALYLMGVWSHHLVDSVQALDYLRLGFKEALQQQMSANALALFCRAATVIDSDEVFAWLYQADSLWGNYEISQLFLSELSSFLDAESGSYQILLTRWQTKTLIHAADHLNLLNSTVEQLQRGFRQLRKDTQLLRPLAES